MIDAGGLALAAQLVWMPDALWSFAGARRGARTGGLWDADDVRLTELVSEIPPWMNAALIHPDWRVQKDPRAAFIAWSATRAITALPELVALELARRGAAPIDARTVAVRRAALELGCRPVALRLFAGRLIPVDPWTASSVCRWLLDASTAGRTRL
ncbi:MAG: hypothetical protein QM779_11835 [Propionicimonas sp.]|uniref:hypothetical protein n=1 Tax=Propionicimonas sp. TaxID=1955623 RepID=UPI003D147D59